MSALSDTSHGNNGVRVISGKAARSLPTVVVLRSRTIAKLGDVCRVGRQTFSEGSSETPLARGNGVTGGNLSVGNPTHETEAQALTW